MIKNISFLKYLMSRVLKLLLHLMYQSRELINSLWPSDTVWQHRSGSAYVQVMAWCLVAPRHCLKKKLSLARFCGIHLWPDSHFTLCAQATILLSEFENCFNKIIARSSRGQWVNYMHWLIICCEIFILFTQYVPKDMLMFGCVLFPSGYNV